MRQHFLLDPNIVFLNPGSYGACPRVVFQAYQDWQLEMERNPVAFLGRRSAALLRDARIVLASYLGARADDLVFVANATTGVNIVARSLDFRPGDEILTTDLEYGACIATWERVCQQRGATLRRVEIALPLEADRFVDHLFNAVTKRTRLLFTSHLTSGTALILPIADLCRRARAAGIISVIDGAHAPAQLELNLQALDADFYIGNCHKWMCAPKGSAFLHAQTRHHAALHATVVSWGDVATEGTPTDRDSFTGESLLERRLQWQGTRDIAAFLSVPAAIAWQQKQDWNQQRARCHGMAVDLLHRVSSRLGQEPIGRSTDFGQMVPIPVPHTDAAALRRRLFEQHHIEVPVTQHAGCLFVRVSVQAYNTAAELQLLEDVLLAR